MMVKRIHVIVLWAAVAVAAAASLAYAAGGDAPSINAGGIGAGGIGAEGRNARNFIAGVEAYQKGDYDSAVALFGELIQSGAANSKLYYNLGNAYLKQGDLGRAILWYEKARKAMPHNPDLLFNLNYARSLTKDIGESDDTSLVRIFFFWKYQLSAATVIVMAIVCNLLFWMAVGAYRVTRRKGLRTAALIILIPTIVFVLTAGFNYYEATHRQRAIILPSQVAVRAGLEDTSTTLFELHAGAKVNVLKQLKGHYQIRFSEDKLGWVSQDAIGLL